jgi:cell division septation protein DedD
MSKLDYVTISIVVVCVAAIIFLVVKTSRLMNANDPNMAPSSVEEALSKQQQEEEDFTPFEGGNAASDVSSQAGTGAVDDPDDNEVKSFDPSGEQSFDNEPATAENQSDKRPNTNVAPPKRTPTTSARSTTAQGGRFMVVAGSFRYKANAEQMVGTLRKLGYNQADVGYTNNGTYAVAVVDRFDDRAQAKALVSALKETHKIDAIVKLAE